MRLDVDNYSAIKIRSSNQTSLLSNLNDEINQLPNDIYSIERISLSRTRKINDNDDEYSSKNAFILRCKLLDKLNPIIPPTSFTYTNILSRTTTGNFIINKNKATKIRIYRYKKKCDTTPPCATFLTRHFRTK